MKSTICGVSDEAVKIKLSECIFVYLPKDIFKEKMELLKYGQAIVCNSKIKTDSEGLRYQGIEVDNDIEENPIKEQILNLLDEI